MSGNAPHAKTGLRWGEIEGLRGCLVSAAYQVAVLAAVCISGMGHRASEGCITVIGGRSRSRELNTLQECYQAVSRAV